MTQETNRRTVILTDGNQQPTTHQVIIKVLLDFSYAV